MSKYVAAGAGNPLSKLWGPELPSTCRKQIFLSGKNAILTDCKGRLVLGQRKSRRPTLRQPPPKIGQNRIFPLTKICLRHVAGSSGPPSFDNGFAATYLEMFFGLCTQILTIL